MSDRSEIILGALWRLQRELNSYDEELSKLTKALVAAKDEYEEKKFKEMLLETKAVMRSIGDKITAYSRELEEMGIEVNNEVTKTIKSD